MLRVLGSRKTLCNGVSRRDFLEVGGTGLLGLGLSELLRSNAAADSAPGRYFGKAKNCILLFLYGSPSQLETFDVKPEAPVEIRGDFGVIPSCVPGYQVGELLPNTAKIMDRVTVVQSMTHPYPIHGVAYATTGVPQIDVGMELNPHDSRHWPFIGSVIDYLEEQRSDGSTPPVPRNIALPWPFSTRRKGEVPRAGPYAAFLGPAYHPVWTDFEGEGSVPFTKTLAGETLECYDPYIALKSGGRFRMSSAGNLPEDMTLDRLSRRRALVEQFDRERRSADAVANTANFDRFRNMAFTLLTSNRVQAALDLRQESPKVRESYGHSLFGQGALAARRLVEAGSRLATVFWDEFGLAGSGWDTHWDHYNRMKIELAPGFDRGFSGLILDLESRGLLDETLVVCISEHGRTPKINQAKGAGRDHWSRAYSAVFAGAGIARGKVVGRTDRIAGDVIENPVSPKDVLATIYHLLGFNPETMIYDRLGRPLPIAGEGKVRFELFS